MSFDYDLSASHLLRASLLCAACLSAVTVAADSHAQASSIATVPNLRARILPIINHSTWALSQHFVENIVSSTLLSNNPNVESADVTVEDTEDPNTQKLVVRLYEKDTYQYIRHNIMVLRDGTIRAVLRDSLSACDQRCLLQLRDNAVCPDQELNAELQYDTVFATPEIGFGSDWQVPSIKAINDAKREVESTPGMRVKLVPGLNATPQNYFNWLTCPNVRFFGSIAPIDSVTGDIALAEGASLPQDWFTVFRGSTSLQNKVLFFNSDNIATTTMPSSAKEANVRTFVSPLTKLTPENAGNVFSCFWKASLTRSAIRGYPRMRSALDSCEGQYWTRGIYSIAGDDGPIIKGVNVDDIIHFPRPHIYPIPEDNPLPVPDPIFRPGVNQ